MKNVMASEQFSHLLVSSLNIVHYLWGTVKFRIICGNTPHILQPFVLRTALLLSLLPSLPLSCQYLLHVPNQAPLFITAPLLSLSYTASCIEPNNDLSQQNTTLQGPKPQITIELHPQHNINRRSGRHLQRPTQGMLLLYLQHVN